MIMTTRRVDLIEEGVDVALRVRERLDTDADVQVKKIGSSVKILVASPRFLAQVGQPAAPAELSRFPLLHQHEQPGPSAWTLKKGGMLETIEFKPRLATGDFGVLASAACVGLGIALLPRAICRTELASGQLVQVLPDWAAPEGIVHLVFTSRRGMLPSVRAVIDFAAETLRAASD